MRSCTDPAKIIKAASENIVLCIVAKKYIDIDALKLGTLFLSILLSQKKKIIFYYFINAPKAIAPPSLVVILLTEHRCIVLLNFLVVVVLRLSLICHAYPLGMRRVYGLEIFGNHRLEIPSIQKYGAWRYSSTPGTTGIGFSSVFSGTQMRGELLIRVGYLLKHCR